jgi:hypothetical protein
VANFAFFAIEIAPRRDVGRIGPERIDAVFCLIRDAAMQEPSCNGNLGGRRFAAGAGKAGNHDGVESAQDDSDRQGNQGTADKDFSSHDLNRKFAFASFLEAGSLQAKRIQRGATCRTIWPGIDQV